jgi:hypothetical protein
MQTLEMTTILATGQNPTIRFYSASAAILQDVAMRINADPRTNMEKGCLRISAGLRGDDAGSNTCDKCTDVSNQMWSDHGVASFFFRRVEVVSK